MITVIIVCHVTPLLIPGRGPGGCSREIAFHSEASPAEVSKVRRAPCETDEEESLKRVLQPQRLVKLVLRDFVCQYPTRISVVAEHKS